MSGDVVMTNRLASEELQKRYKQALQFTTGTIFGKGDRFPSKSVMDEVVRRNKTREDRETAAS